MWLVTFQSLHSVDMVWKMSEIELPCVSHVSAIVKASTLRLLLLLLLLLLCNVTCDRVTGDMTFSATTVTGHRVTSFQWTE